jgi:hypothetical protein
MARKKNTEQKKETTIKSQDQPEPPVIVDNIQQPLVNKSKRGRKPKNHNLVVSSDDKNTINDKEQNVVFEISDVQNDKIEEDQTPNDNDEPVKTTGKKRGRKPKGGKIIQQIVASTSIKESKPNIILHLKCSLKDLQNNLIENNINGYDFTSYKKELLYEIITNNNNNNHNNQSGLNSNLSKAISEDTSLKNDYCDEDFCENDTFICKKNEMKDLWKKLKNLEYSLHLNNISDKKSACFWCTYEFDNPPIYIPKHFIKESYHVYGCFCSPECATAHLMEENVDSSTKFERYHLLNHIYSKIYGYTKNIKPAPNPYYMLEKFYGNLNIQEYRSLLKNERLFLVVDKPLTRILPELHEDNDDFIINNKIIPSNTYQIKKKILNKQTKNTILSEKFGLH